MGFFIALTVMFGTYMVRFSGDFDEENRQKITLFIVAIFVLGIIIALISK